MLINSIDFTNYRNLQNTRIFPKDGLNFICGENAQGKTNMLESIWLFSGNRSFRGAQDIDYVSFNAPQTRLSMDLFSRGRRQKIEILFCPNKKSSRTAKYVLINDVPQKKISDVVGNLNCVLFSPAHLSLIKGAPSERRKFLDMSLFQAKASYGSLLKKYTTVLLQRNALLKKAFRDSKAEQTLDIWDETFSMLASHITFERLEYVKKLEHKASEELEKFSLQKESLSLTYTRTVLDLDREGFLTEFRKHLRRARSTDIKFGTTTLGPHRDDLEIKINGRSAKIFASQGQQRSIVLAIKLAEVELLTEKYREKPVILLDDVMSELDLLRRNHVLEAVQNYQVFITCCTPNALDEGVSGKIFHIDNGKITQ